MRPVYKQGAFWIILFMLCLVGWVLMNKQRASEPEKIENYWTLVKKIENDEIASMNVQKDKVTGKYRKPNKDDQEEFTSVVDSTSEHWQQLLATYQGRFELTFEEEAEPPFWHMALINWLPMLLLVALFFMFLRNMQAQSGRAMQFGKSRARLLDESEKRVTFDDVAGVEEAKEELEEIVQFLKDPTRFTRLGGKIPKGVLLVGPPGTGKTLLAKAVAGEAGVPFFTISGSDFVEMFVGVGASRVRDLFEQGKRHAPCIIFVDEIDAVGRERGAGLGGGHDEREQTLNQLLVELDGFASDDHVIVMAATNRVDVLDPALLRPGRFDRRITVPLPTSTGRESILRIHARKIPLAGDVDLGAISRGTSGMSGADLANLLNEAALLAARRNHDLVTPDDVDDAKDRVLMGARRSGVIMSDHEKRTTAYHEAGHAIVAAKTEGADPVHKVTIVPRGQALGLTQQLPIEDRYALDSTYLEGMITILMGGRAAEELVLDDMTTGAGNDIKRATDLARRMVTEWGMSDKIGPLNYGSDSANPFLGRELSRSRDYSETTAVAIDNAVADIVKKAYERALSLLRTHNDALHRLAQALLEREEIDGKELNSILNGTPGLGAA